MFHNVNKKFTSQGYYQQNIYIHTYTWIFFLLSLPSRKKKSVEWMVQQLRKSSVHWRLFTVCVEMISRRSLYSGGDTPFRIQTHMVMAVSDSHFKRLSLRESTKSSVYSGKMKRKWTKAYQEERNRDKIHLIKRPIQGYYSKEHVSDRYRDRDKEKEQEKETSISWANVMDINKSILYIIE